jgi:deferrochelatase/peroxidase EfeB
MIAVLLTAIVIGAVIFLTPDLWQQPAPQKPATNATGAAADALTKLPVKGRAPKTNYKRTQFGDGWAITRGCDTRNIILHRDLTDAAVNDACKVLSGTLQDPYTGKTITFARGAGTSDDVQIDHVVALSDAWQKGAQQLSMEERKQLANDPLELLAVDGPANQEKSDGDAATWLPSNKAFRCQYVARQIAVKTKYRMWVTQAEHDIMSQILAVCPGQELPTQ